MQDLALEVINLSKAFGGARWPRRKDPFHAVKHVSFRVERGEIYGIIGANGSGKSTLIRMISTLLWADEGHIAVFGLDSREAKSCDVRKLINRVSPDPSFFRNMSALENLLFFGARVRHDEPAEVTQRADEILEELDLGGRLREPMTHLSRGQQQKVAIARAFLTSPVLMLLDEPTTGLDPHSKRDVQQFILRRPQRARRDDPADDARHGRGRQALRPAHVSRWRAHGRRRARRWSCGSSVASGKPLDRVIDGDRLPRS